MLQRNPMYSSHMQVQQYLFFDGRCEEAIEFYKTTLGAKVETLMRFKDNPEAGGAQYAPPGFGVSWMVIVPQKG